MKKIGLFLFLLVIILVSLNWFNTVSAQSLDQLTDEQKQTLYDKFNKSDKADLGNETYQTPQLYSETSDSTKNILERHRTNLQEEGTQKGFADGQSNLTPFESLKPFGMNLFENVHQSEMPTEITSSSDYILGPGDNIVIYLWGRVEKEFNLVIDREGKVFIPEIGSLYAWGLSLETFTNKAKEAFDKPYSDFSINVSLGKIRSIRIYVAGEVKYPGAYTVSSLTSMFNALYLAGGPNERGSMRQIKLMRKGNEVTKVDLYKLLLEGDNSTDVRLMSGDVVFVPVAGNQVAIRGEVRREGIYELLGDETSKELLTLAGGANPKAHLERVMLERVDNSGEWKVLDLNLKPASAKESDLMLASGDRISVYSIFDMKKNMVAVFGQVKHPGYYERGDSTYLSDLLDRVQLHPYDVYLDRADIFRRYADNRIEIIPVNLNKLDKNADILLNDRDSVHIYSINDIDWDRYVYIEGEVKNPGKYPLYKNMTLEDLVFLAGSYTREAQKHNSEIARLNDNGKVDILEVGLERSEAQHTYLKEEDHIYIRKIPEWEKNRTVAIKGEVNYPGTYTLVNRNETLYNLVQRAGGFTPKAFPTGTVFERNSIRNKLEKLQVDKIIERTKQVQYDTLGNIVEENRVDYDSLSLNRIIIDMDKIVQTDGKEGDIVLEPGDQITIPNVPTGISVLGAVSANGTLKFTDDKNVKYYIDRAGNFTRQADKKSIRLIKATGEVYNGGNILKQKVELGDIVVVPTKIDKKSNWLKNVTTALSAATGILTSVYIVSKI